MFSYPFCLLMSLIVFIYVYPLENVEEAKREEDDQARGENWRDSVLPLDHGVKTSFFENT